MRHIKFPAASTFVLFIAFCIWGIVTKTFSPELSKIVEDMLVGFCILDIIRRLAILYVKKYGMPDWMHADWCMFQLCRYMWYRRLSGGRWEEWIVNDYFQTLWFKVDPNNHYPEHRPAGAHGTPVVEVYKTKG